MPFKLKFLENLSKNSADCGAGRLTDFHDMHILFPDFGGLHTSARYMGHPVARAPLMTPGSHFGNPPVRPRGGARAAIAKNE